MSKVFPLLAIATLSLGLVACSADTEPDANGGAPVDGANCQAFSVDFASSDVEVCGEHGEPNSASFSFPLEVSTTEFSTVIEGTGDEVRQGDSTMIAYSIYNSTSGEPVSNAEMVGTVPTELITLDNERFLLGLVAALDGQKVGSRVLAVVPPAEGYGAEGNLQVGLGETDNLLWVLDVLQKVESQATGSPQEVSADFPEVTLSETGQPSVSIPDAAPATELQLGVLKQGDGETVAAGAEVWVQYMGVNWRTGEVFDQSWGRQIAQFPLANVVPGFSQAIEGQQIGSQVIAVIPPELGYGPNGGQPSAGIEADDTLVFVIDILAVKNL